MLPQRTCAPVSVASWTRLRASEEALYVSKRGRLTGVLLDVDRYAELVDRVEYLEDSLAALHARDERDESVPWTEVRQ